MPMERCKSAGRLKCRWSGANPPPEGSQPPRGVEDKWGKEIQTRFQPAGWKTLSEPVDFPIFTIYKETEVNDEP